MNGLNDSSNMSIKPRSVEIQFASLFWLPKYQYYDNVGFSTHDSSHLVIKVIKIWLASDYWIKCWINFNSSVFRFVFRYLFLVIRTSIFQCEKLLDLSFFFVNNIPCSQALCYRFSPNLYKKFAPHCPRSFANIFYSNKILIKLEGETTQ